MTHPIRVRGLKLGKITADNKVKIDAPYSGARIETSCPFDESYVITTHPIRVRGLKQKKHVCYIGWGMDAPYSGARIETPRSFCSSDPEKDAPYSGARIETTIQQFLLHRHIRRTLFGCED